MATALNLDGLTAAQLFQLRANTKRSHTTIVTRINGLVTRQATIADCTRQLELLKTTFTRLQAINNRYMASPLLDEQDRLAAHAYMQSIYQTDQQTRQLVANYIGPQAPQRQGSWLVSDSVVNQPLRRGWSVTPNATTLPSLPLSESSFCPPLNDYQHDIITPAEAPSEATQAKRRKLLLELELEDNRRQNEQEVEALLLARQQLDNNLLSQIRNEERIIALSSPSPANGLVAPSHPTTEPGPPALSSTMIAHPLPQPTIPSVPVAPAPIISHSSSRWNKITVQKFNGDPRSWKRFDQGVTATIKDSTMPDSLKLLSLEDLLVDEIRKRVAHLFTGTGSSFTNAYTELKTKYGSPGLVMQAHNTHLLQALPIKVGDFNALFTLAADVRDAVSSVSADHMLAFTYSTVVSSLASKLPTQLQIDWGKFAYALQPALPTLQDFDRWIDIAVGAEENRGNRFLAPPQRQTQPVPRQQQQTYGQAGSSGYRHPQNVSHQTTNVASHSPTILTQSVSQDMTRLPTTFPRCSVCNEDPGHRLDFCNTFKRMLVNQRATVVADNNHCFKCLIKGHYGRECRRTPPIKCHTCNEGHHTLLHGADRQFPNKKGIISSDILILRAPLTVGLQPVLLAIVPITLLNGSVTCNTFAILDNGSEATLVTKSLAKRLGVSGTALQIRLGTLTSSVLLDSEIVSFSLQSLLETHEATGVFIVPQINISFRRIDWPSIKGNWAHLADLNLPLLDSSSVEMLIGMDQVYAHITRGFSAPLPGETGPVAINTVFGWAVVGRLPPALISGPTNKKRINLNSISAEADLSTLVERFHLSASVNPSAKPSSISFDDAQAIAVLESSIQFVGCGWQVELPLRSSHLLAPNNRDQAVSRFFGLERRLSRPENADYANKYNIIMLKLLDSGVAELVPRSDINSPEGMVWYLPHHFVLYPNKPGKIRVVMDWAVNYHGFVLNKHLYRGPSLVPSLVGVLLRSRQFLVAVSADIEAFYHRIGIPKHQRSLQRFVFREFGSTKPLLTYQLTTLVFGAINASTSAIWVLHHAMHQNKAYPDIAATVVDYYYSDNLSKSFETEEQAIAFSKDSIASMALGGFNLTGFASSSKRVLAALPEKDRAPPVRDLNFDALPTEYILGMGWDCATDRYHLRAKSMPSVSTKRELLSALSRSFDPLGLCLPVITYARLLFQSACNSRTAVGSGFAPLAWDEPLPECILAKWNLYSADITLLSRISIKRCFRPDDFPLNECIFDLLVYCDASSSAYSTIAFLRTTCGTRAHISFVMAKGTLVGKNKLTIPRLELKAAVLAVQMTQMIKQELRLPITSIEYLTDSQVVLYQLQSNHINRPFFVKNRLEQILNHSNKEQWFYVKSKDNIADDATRGLTPAQFRSDCRWINGPPLPLTYTRTAIADLKSPIHDPECPPIINVGQLNVSLPSPECSRPEVSRFIKECHTDINHLKRSVALYLRSDNQSNEPLTDTELREAFRICLITAAEESFPREIKALMKKIDIPRDSVLRNLNPYIDSVDGQLKVDGRLKHAELPERTRHPTILAPDHPLTSLIIADAHHGAHHAGVEHTLAIVRTQYYLLRGRRAIRKILIRCDTCRFNNSQPTAPMMANLPKERLEAYVRPFNTTGIDLFGPFIVVIGRRVEKRWILIATCFSTRAIHLELVYSLSVDSCLMAIRRFIADRGHPRTVFSDNGTNLVAAEKELNEGITNLNSNLITEEMVDRGIDWKFSPPTGSHFGGPYERLVASCKRSLVAVLGQRSVTDEVLLTVMKEVASLLNSRPITRVSTDPSEPEPLTPNHFILGCHHPHVPPDIEAEFDGLSRRRWKQAQYIVDQFWRRWMREYVPELIERDK